MDIKNKRLNFLTAGKPLSALDPGYQKAFEVLESLNLDGLELEFVHGIKIKENTQNLIAKLSKEKNLILTAHAPFYINLNAKEPEKIESSIKRIIETARIGVNVNAFSITFHAAYYLGQDKLKVYDQVEQSISKIIDLSNKENLNIWIRPETTGKPTQWGDLDEIIKLSKTFNKILPCVDFSHLHARSNGGYNTYDDFAKIFEKIGSELGDIALKNFHAHLAGIEYNQKGEKFHVNLDDSDMNYKDLLKAFKDFDVQGVIVCESPNIETDAKMIKEYYLSL